MKNDIIDLAAERNRKSFGRKVVHMCDSMWKKLHKEPEQKPMATRPDPRKPPTPPSAA